MSVLALILAGGPGAQLSVLSAERPKPAQPFGGKYRIIDVALSNATHSGLDTVAVLAQFNPVPLARHLGAGRPWDLDRNPPRGLQLWLPTLAGGDPPQYRGTAHAVYHNRRLIAESGCDRVVILPGDQICRQDYRSLLAYHDEQGAALTISTCDVLPEDAHRFGIVDVDADYGIIGFTEKPPQPHGTLVSMGIYVFNTSVLLDALSESVLDFGRDLLPDFVRKHRAVAYPFEGDWTDIGTVQGYWETNLTLLDDPPRFDVAAAGWPIFTRSEPRPPVRLGAQSVVRNALLSDGCIIRGTVERSVLSPGVVVEAGAVVRNSVIMHATRVGAGAVVDRCILDERVRIGPGAQLGPGNAPPGTDAKPNEREPDKLHTGITVVGKGARIPAGVTIGRNCCIDPRTAADDYDRSAIADGATVSRRL